MSSSPHLFSTSCCLCSGLIVVRQPPHCPSCTSSQLMWSHEAMQSLPLTAAARQPLTARLQTCRPLASNLQSNIHTAVFALVQGSENLKAFDQYMRDTTLKLNRKVEDLEDVRFLMGVLKEVRASAVSVCAEIPGRRTQSGPQLCSGLSGIWSVCAVWPASIFSMRIEAAAQPPVTPPCTLD